MLLPTLSFDQAKSLIDRGVQSGFRVYPSTAYYLITADQARNSRVAYFPRSGAIPQK
jgi:predicted LPLAT superfamily acyltransferase